MLALKKSRARWRLGGRLMRGIRSIHFESPETARIDHLQPSIGGLPVHFQSTHEAALDVVDLGDLKRRTLELT
jgi:hypothetical protein